MSKFRKVSFKIYILIFNLTFVNLLIKTSQLMTSP